MQIINTKLIFMTSLTRLLSIGQNIENKDSQLGYNHKHWLFIIQLFLEKFEKCDFGVHVNFKFFSQVGNPNSNNNDMIVFSYVCFQIKSPLNWVWFLISFHKLNKQHQKYSAAYKLIYTYLWHCPSSSKLIHFIHLISKDGGDPFMQSLWFMLTSQNKAIL